MGWPSILTSWGDPQFFSRYPIILISGGVPQFFSRCPVPSPSWPMVVGCQSGRDHPSGSLPWSNGRQDFYIDASGRLFLLINVWLLVFRGINKEACQNYSAPEQKQKKRWNFSSYSCRLVFVSWFPDFEFSYNVIIHHSDQNALDIFKTRTERKIYNLSGDKLFLKVWPILHKSSCKASINAVDHQNQNQSYRLTHQKQDLKHWHITVIWATQYFKLPEEYFCQVAMAAPIL